MSTTWNKKKIITPRSSDCPFSLSCSMNKFNSLLPGKTLWWEIWCCWQVKSRTFWRWSSCVPICWRWVSEYQWGWNSGGLVSDEASSLNMLRKKYTTYCRKPLKIYKISLKKIKLKKKAQPLPQVMKGSCAAG